MNQKPFLTKKHGVYLTDAQLAAELAKCEFCEDKPCRTACPVNCSPADFIMAARVGNDTDIARAAHEIMKNNPLGGVCGAVCPDTHCQKACVHKNFDCYVQIPAVQATLIAKAKALKKMPKLAPAKKTGKRVAVVGSGPAGLSAAATLARLGHAVTVFEREKKAGGAMRTIPTHRLPTEILDSDICHLVEISGITLKTGCSVADPLALKKDFDAVVVAGGLWQVVMPGVPGEEMAIRGLDFLRSPGKFRFSGRVAIYGGGATALDCATTALARGAEQVEMICLENQAESPLTPKEWQELVEHGIELTMRTRLLTVEGKGKKINALTLCRVELPAGERFHPRIMRDVPDSVQRRGDIRHLIISIGARPELRGKDGKGIFYTGDAAFGPSTVVEAAAAGKNTAFVVDAALRRRPAPKIARMTKSEYEVPGYVDLPVSLEADFFGRKIRSPFLLSAAPPSDGYEQMVKAYEAGWAGGVMKTTFHESQGDIHIPGAYMFKLMDGTYGNCDNVSGHRMKRLVKEIRKLVEEWPDRLTMVSTGGPISGNDEADRKAWQRNTRELENAGAMGIEYSLSCPQGGDGTEGDIVAQNAALTAKIIDWVMEISDPQIPKLFKLTGAVTSIIPIARAIKEVFRRYPKKKAGITLANTFPALAFRPGSKKEWDEGYVVGMSGEGVTFISNLNLANVAGEGLTVSGNGGPMNYKAAADFLALGVQTVQFCTIATKHGVGIIRDLEQGLSFLMQERGIRKMKDLIGRALPQPITGFMEIPAEKMISDVHPELCEHCGNCGRCPYLAISYDKNKVPVTDPARCIGCSICVQKCFSGALMLRPRTKKEAALLKED